jgi:hypothetical protein
MSNVLVDEVQVTLTTSKKLTSSQIDEIRHILLSKAFMRELKQAIQGVVQRHPDLEPLKISLTR